MFRQFIRFIFLCFIVFLPVKSLFAQNLEVVSGPSFGRFWSFKRDDVGFARDYGKPHIGYFVGLECSNLRIDSMLNFRVGVQLESYQGDLNMAAGSHGYGMYNKGNVKKTILGCSFYPLNLKPTKNWCISLGVQAHVVMAKELNGNSSGWGGFGPTATSYNNAWSDIDGFLRTWNMAFVFQPSYSFYWNNWVLEPRISATVGLSNEIPKLIYDARHFRLIPAIGIGYAFK